MRHLCCFTILLICLLSAVHVNGKKGKQDARICEMGWKGNVLLFPLVLSDPLFSRERSLSESLLLSPWSLFHAAYET